MRDAETELKKALASPDNFKEKSLAQAALKETADSR
jgi:hypothetical protein